MYGNVEDSERPLDRVNGYYNSAQTGTNVASLTLALDFNTN